jgi:hypothetical protein
MKASGKDEHFGTIGKREVWRLRVVFTKAIDSFYGVTYLHIFVDAEGRQAKWFSSSERLDKDATYDLKGTVKAHEVYDGRKGTVLSRCKVVKKLEEAVSPEAPEASKVSEVRS